MCHYGPPLPASRLVEGERDRVTRLSSRVVRIRLFRRLVVQDYDKRCAITGPKLVNDGDARKFSADI